MAFLAGLFHLFATWPLFSAPHRLLPGWEGDNVMFAWNLWLVAEGPQEFGSTLGRTHALLHPEGFPFLFHTHTWLYGKIHAAADWAVLSRLGLDLLARLTLGYNLLMLASSVLTALGLWAIVRLHGVRDWRGSVLATLAGTFCGARLFALYGHLNLVGTEFFIWSVYFLCRALKGRMARDWAAAGALSGLALLNCQINGTFALLAGVLAFATLLAGRPAPRLWLGAGLAYGAAFLAVAAFHLVPLAAVFRSGDYLVASAHELRTHDALNLLLPSDYNAFVGPVCYRLRGALGIVQGSGVGHPGSALYLALACFLWQQRGTPALGVRPRGDRPLLLFWWLMALLGVVAVLGERLTLAGHNVVPLPFRIFREVPVLNNLRIPERFILFLVLPLTVIAARALERGGGALAIGFAVLVILQGRMLPVAVRTDIAPIRLEAAVVESIRAAGGSVLTLPISYENNRALIWQVQHGRPEMFGRSTRLSPKLQADREAAFPFLKQLGSPVTITRDDEAVRAFIRHGDLKTILVPAGSETAWADLLRVAPAEVWGSEGVRTIFLPE